MTAREAYDPARHGRDTPQDTFGPEVLVDRAAEGRIHVITLNRPHRLNALGGGLRIGAARRLGGLPRRPHGARRDPDRGRGAPSRPGPT